MKTLALVFIAWCFLPLAAQAEERPIARKLIALYDSRSESSPRTSQTHRFLEMPANYLGFDIHYYDVNAPLPEPGDDVAGIVTWFASGTEVPDPEMYLAWLNRAAEENKKLIFIENAGIGDTARRDPDLMQQWNRVLAAIGLADNNGWNAVTYRARVVRLDKDMVGFERDISPSLPPFGDTRAIPGISESHLQVALMDSGENERADLVVTSARGGYIAEGYAIFHIVEDDESKISQWFVNPFRFLKTALDLKLVPIPDITTLNGRRIFYSHIDGDGWNNISEISRYRKKNTIAAEIIRREVLEPYGDFAFTVGLITGDVDPDCYGVKDSEAVARAIYALPNVEPSSHTHSHPLFWRYFADYTQTKEQPFIGRYPPRPKQTSSLMETIKEAASDGWAASHAGPQMKTPADTRPLGSNDEPDDVVLKKYYATPRSYACSAFSLEDEVEGSLARVNELCPPGKTARLLQWSGDTSPFPSALGQARKAGVYNINGGDSRFDSEYPSYSSVAPIGFNIGGERQIYSSNSNENTYTNLWTGRFFGFRYLQTTVENTEHPLRVRPFNLYFHIYSGEKEASLKAVQENLDYARRHPLIPIRASDYAAIAEGFFTARIIPLSESGWRIDHRGELQTLRFDGAERMAVDFSASKGVIGQQYFQKNLYVFLDPEVATPIVNLIKNQLANQPPSTDVAYLIASRWAIKDLSQSKSLLTFHAQGYGDGVMTWKMPRPGEYVVRVERQKKQLVEKRLATGADGLLEFTLPGVNAIESLQLSIGAL